MEAIYTGPRALHLLKFANWSDFKIQKNVSFEGSSS